MKKKILVGLILAIVHVGLLWLNIFSPFVMDGLILLYCLIGLREMIKAAKKLEYNVMLLPLAIFYTLAYPAIVLGGRVWQGDTNVNGAGIGLLGAFLIFFISAGIVYILNPKVSLKDFFITIFIGVYPIMLLNVAMILNHVGGSFLVFFVLLIALFTDTFAYLFGSFYNKKIKRGKAKRLIERVSPNKTLAGAIGGFIGCLGILALYWFLVEYNSSDGAIITLDATLRSVFAIGDYISDYIILVFYMLIGAVVCIIAQLGDLFASRIKRECGFKDFGTLIPGHGGVIDRIDAIMFAAVALFVIVLAVGMF